MMQLVLKKRKTHVAFGLELLGVDQRCWSAAAELKPEAQIHPSKNPVNSPVDLDKSIKYPEAHFSAEYSERAEWAAKNV